MNLMGRHHLNDFSRKHPPVRPWVSLFVHMVEAAEWEKPTDVLEDYPTASPLPNHQMVFNVKGNSYRVLVSISYQNKKMAILKCGTHAEYNRWNISVDSHASH